MKRFLLPLLPVLVGAFVAYSDRLTALVANNPKLSTVVGALVAAALYVAKSPWVQEELKKAEEESK